MPEATYPIPVYVISLADAEIRRRNMTARLDRMRIPFRFVDAVDARWTRLPDWFDGARVVREGFYSESAIGSAASHRLVHRMVAEGDSDVALVLEDDAKFADDFPEVLPAATRLDFDVLKLEGGPRRRRTTLCRLGRYSVVVGMTPSLGGAAYLLRRAGALRLCSLPVLDQGCDEAFNDFRLSLRVIELDPYPAVQDGETATLLTFQQYPPGFKREIGLSRKLLDSLRKRERLIRLYGFRVALALELQKFRSSA